ncbi:MAG: HtaA domain-containing protein [Microbacterium sp.]
MSFGAGVLLWGVKASFLGYVSRSGGSVALTAPAVYRDGVFGFPRTDSDEIEGTLSFAGGVRFVAHGGLLDVRLDSPSVTVGDTASISVVASIGEGPKRLVIADLHASKASFAEGQLVWLAKLSATGALLFESTYPEGTELDPVLILGPEPR